MATNINITQITPPRVPIIDDRTGAVSREWYRWFYNIFTITGGSLGITPIINGGTGLNTIPTNGQLLIGNGTGYTLNTLAVGNGISIVNGLGTITLANTGVLSNIAGNGISVSGATGDVTITNTGVLSFSGGTTGLTPATATTGAVTLAGTLGIANGGTNGSATPTTNGIAYGTGTTYAFTAAGTAKQVLIANTSAAPTWTTLTSGASILYGDGSGGFSNVTIGTGVSFAGGTLSATGTGGTVTSVTGTSPVVSSGGTTPAISLASAYGDTLNPYGTKTANYVLAGPTTGAATVPAFRALVAGDIPSAALTRTDDTNVTLTLGGSPTTALVNAASLTLGWSGQLAVGRGGTGLSAGTSGGIPYFSSASAMTSSALLASNAIVLGGGAGAAPATTTTGTGVVTALGVNTGTAGAFVVNGGALGTPSSGTVTNLTGTASININGTVGATTPAAGTFTSLSDSGNLTFTGTGNRITGDFSNSTIASRIMFQTTTANTGSQVGILPNGTALGTFFNAYANSDPTNTSFAQFGTTAGTEVRVASSITGTGTYLPMTFYTGGSERARIDTSGNFYISTANLWQYAPAPTTKAAAATLTAAELATDIITLTGTTYTITLPTGAALDTYYTGVVTTNIGYDFHVINTASGIITIAVGASGMTSVGLLTIAATVSAHFRLRRTAANTYVLYRIS
jgi:hypothetical protein